MNMEDNILPSNVGGAMTTQEEEPQAAKAETQLSIWTPWSFSKIRKSWSLSWRNTGRESAKSQTPSNDAKERIAIFYLDNNTNLTSVINKVATSGSYIISPVPHDDWKSVADQSSCVIICHSHKSNSPMNYMEEYFNYCIEKHGYRNIKVVITDPEDAESETKIKDEWRKRGFPDGNIMTLRNAELNKLSKTDIKTDNELENGDAELEQKGGVILQLEMGQQVTSPLHQNHIITIIGSAMKMAVAELAACDRGSGQKNKNDLYEEKIRRIKEILTDTDFYFWTKKHRVGIFSRSSESEYDWLNLQLKCKSFQYNVESVRPCYISNNGSRQFREDVSQCTFGILYHTKNRGRINITDVTDSLYDAELEYMSQALGNSKVIVVVDDLDDSSEEQKSRILENQPSIRRLAQDLFLFTTNEKKKIEQQLKKAD